MKTKILLVLGLAVSASAVSAQTMTLGQGIEAGLERNLQVRTVAQDLRLADMTRSENRSTLLKLTGQLDELTK